MFFSVALSRLRYFVYTNWMYGMHYWWPVLVANLLLVPDIGPAAPSIIGGRWPRPLLCRPAPAQMVPWARPTTALTAVALALSSPLLLLAQDDCSMLDLFLHIDTVQESCCNAVTCRGALGMPGAVRMLRLARFLLPAFFTAASTALLGARQLLWFRPINSWFVAARWPAAIAG